MKSYQKTKNNFRLILSSGRRAGLWQPLSDGDHCLSLLAFCCGVDCDLAEIS